MFNGMPFSVGAMKIKTLPLLVGAAALLAGTSTAVIAQELQRGASVLERPRPELEPLGLRAGSFLIFPKFEFGTAYDDNVFATERKTDGDFIFQFIPSVAIRSDFSAHELHFRAGADVGRYADLTSENFIDYFTEAGGRYDITGSSAVNANVAYRKLHEDRGSPDAPTGASEPVEYSQTTTDLGYQQRFNRLVGRIGFNAIYENYDDVTSNAGTNLDQDNRDRWLYASKFRLGYDLVPGYTPFVQVTYTRTTYEHGIKPADSDTYEAVVGTSFDLTGLLTGEVFVGYLTKNYDENVFDDFSGVTYGAALDWAVTQLTSLRGEASKHIEEGFGRTPTPRDRSTFQIGVDHELLRNVILSARALYQNDDYQGAPRNDDFYSLQAGATYTFNRNLYLRGTYTYSTRDSNLPGNDYDRNLIALKVGAQL
jgi:hypothetical protein